MTTKPNLSTRAQALLDIARALAPRCARVTLGDVRGELDGLTEQAFAAACLELLDADVVTLYRDDTPARHTMYTVYVAPNAPRHLLYVL